MKLRKIINLFAMGLLVAQSLNAQPSNSVLSEVRTNLETGNTVTRNAWTHNGGKLWVRVTNPLNKGITDASQNRIEAMFGGGTGLVSGVGFMANFDGSGAGGIVTLNGPFVGGAGGGVATDAKVFGTTKRTTLQLNVRPRIKNEGLLQSIAPSNIRSNFVVTEGNARLSTIEIHKNIWRRNNSTISGKVTLNRQGNISGLGIGHGVRF